MNPLGEVRSFSMQTISHEEHRDKGLVGDWGYHPASQRIGVLTSRFEDWRFGFVCALHELVEAALCVQDGVSEKAVCDYDLAFENARDIGTFDQDDEPGEMPDAPYRHQHAVADVVERLVLESLGARWHDYARANAQLDAQRKKFPNEQSRA